MSLSADTIAPAFMLFDPFIPANSQFIYYFLDFYEINVMVKVINKGPSLIGGPVSF
jgi:hypothetical protein